MKLNLIYEEFLDNTIEVKMRSSYKGYQKLYGNDITFNAGEILSDTIFESIHGARSHGIIYNILFQFKNNYRNYFNYSFLLNLSTDEPEQIKEHRLNESGYSNNGFGGIIK